MTFFNKEIARLLKAPLRLPVIFIASAFAFSGYCAARANAEISSDSYNRPMTFYTGCTANAIESCYMHGIGRITQDTYLKFRELLNEAMIITLSSPGGDLGGGIDLGREIRRAGRQTQIEGLCESACAYAFLGGTVRFFRPENKLGFHQFYWGGDDPSGTISQSLSAQVLAYVLEMGIDARLFISASATPFDKMHYLTEEQAIDVGISPPNTFSPIDLEPYKGGIIAFSKRQIPLEPYDASMQVTFYCRGRGEPFALMTAVGPEESNPAVTNGYVEGIWSDSPGRITADDHMIDLPPGSVYQRFDPGFLYYEVEMKKEWLQRLINASDLNITIDRPRVMQWSVRMNLELNDGDRQALSAAFRFCIE